MQKQYYNDLFINKTVKIWVFFLALPGLHLRENLSQNQQVCAYLVRISIQVKVLQEAGGKLTKQEVVSLVDGPQTPVRVVVGTGAGTEGAH